MKKGIVLPLVLILTAVALAIGTFFIIDNKQKSPVKTTSKPVVQASLTPDNNSNLQTYTCQFGEFTLKIPLGWVVKPTVNSGGGSIQFIQSADYTQKPYRDSSDPFNDITPTDILSGVLLQVWVTKNVQRQSYEAQLNYYKSLGNDKLEELTLDGMKAIFLDLSKNDKGLFIEGTKKGAVVFAYKDGLSYRFEFSNITGDLTQFRQILSSFKFFPSGQVTNWKTYTNQKFKYSLDYPSYFYSRAQGVVGDPSNPVEKASGVMFAASADAPLWLDSRDDGIVVEVSKVSLDSKLNELKQSIKSAFLPNIDYQEERLTINSNKMIKLTTFLPGHLPDDKFFLINNGIYTYTFWFNGFPLGNSIPDQIVKSFKFTN